MSNVGHTPLHAATGSNLSALGWPQEAAVRMLHNNLDPAVAEYPENLIVYGGTGKAARNWPSFDAIVKTLNNLKGDETLLVQSGKPVGVFQTHEWAPRVLIANSNLVGDWANWPEFRRLEQLGLTMYGQMTAGSWIYIGTQGILQGTYETFAAVAKKHFNGTLAGTLTVTAGCGGMGGAQPLAVTMNEGTCLIVDVDESRIRRRLNDRYLDELADNLDDAIDRALKYKDERKAVSIGLVGNMAEVLPELLRRDVPIDIVTDQTSAHDPLAYLPVGVELSESAEMARNNPDEYTLRAEESMAMHVEAMVGFMNKGTIVFDYGNSIRDEARKGVAQERVQFQGLPARICWLGYGERDKAGAKFNEMVASGEISAPIVIGRDHLDCGSVASPYRESEGMIDGSDAIADWPLLNAMVNIASGASWVSIHHGGGVGIGRSIHAGQVSVADGTELAAQKLQRVLTNDPGMGVIRHVDAGYPEAVTVARQKHVHVPMLDTE